MRLFTLISLILCITYALGNLCAQPPRKPNFSQFSRLVNASPFTIKPQSTQAAVQTPLERDWTLASIRPVGKGYAVTLMNKKDRKNRVRFIPGFSSGEFELLHVKQDSRYPKKSKVQVRRGTQIAWIGYDAKMIKPRTAAAKKKPAPRNKALARPNTARVVRRGGPPVPGLTPNPQTKRRPRVRRVPTKKKLR